MKALAIRAELGDDADSQSRATQNAAIIQSQGFCRTFIVTPIRLSPTGTGMGKLVAKFPNCLDLEVWSCKGASLVMSMKGSTSNFSG